ncbi:TRAP transporter substrate-binding protein DctP [Actibacterium sp. D379-3]
MKKLLLSAVMSVAMCGGALAEEVTLRAVAAWPTSFELTKQFQKFIERVNAVGEGVVQIQLIGGPEVIPPAQQDTALRNGLFDMQMGSASYYNGVVPEGDALFASNITPAEARANGAIDVLEGIWREKLNAHFVAWQSGGIGFHIYLSEEPKFTDDQLDLHGLKLRSASAYKEWFEALGATNVMISMPDTFSAFERGMVQGLGSPGINFADTGVSEFIKYRISPPVWQLDVLVIMNADKWDALPDAAKAIINQAAIEHEEETGRTFKEVAQAEGELLQAAGAEFLVLEGARRDNYVNLAYETIWTRLKTRSPEHYDALRAAFYKE